MVAREVQNHQSQSSKVLTFVNIRGQPPHEHFPGEPLPIIRALAVRGGGGGGAQGGGGMVGEEVGGGIV